MLILLALMLWWAIRQGLLPLRLLGQVLAQRQAQSWLRSLLNPPVRTRVQMPHETKMAAAMVARR